MPMVAPTPFVHSGCVVTSRYENRMLLLASKRAA
jgi:hypothetical protein